MVMIYALSLFLLIPISFFLSQPELCKEAGPIYPGARLVQPHLHMISKQSASFWFRSDDRVPALEWISLPLVARAYSDRVSLY